MAEDNGIRFMEPAGFGLFLGTLVEDMVDTVGREKYPYIKVLYEDLFFDAEKYPLTYVPYGWGCMLPLHKGDKVWSTFEQGVSLYPILAKPALEYNANVLSGTPMPDAGGAKNVVFSFPAMGKTVAAYPINFWYYNDADERPVPDVDQDNWVICTDAYTLLRHGMVYRVTDKYSIWEFTASDGVVQKFYGGPLTMWVGGKADVDINTNLSAWVGGSVSVKCGSDSSTGNYLGSYTGNYLLTVDGNYTLSVGGDMTYIVKGELIQSFGATTYYYKNTFKSVAFDTWEVANSTGTDYIRFESDPAGVSADIGIGSALKPVSIKGTSMELGAILYDFVNTLLTTVPTTMGSPASQNFNPGIITALTKVATQLKLCLKS